MNFWDDHDAGPEWATPERIWRPLANALGGFDLDPASGCEPEPIARDCFTLDQGLADRSWAHVVANGLENPWYGRVWVNPPYGRAFNDAWAERIHVQAGSPRVEHVTALVSAATSTKRFHAFFSDARYWTFLEGRVGFIGPDASGKASFASVILTFGEVNPEYLAALGELGTVTRPEGI